MPAEKQNGRWEEDTSLREKSSSWKWMAQHLSEVKFCFKHMQSKQTTVVDYQVILHHIDTEFLSSLQNQTPKFYFPCEMILAYTVQKKGHWDDGMCFEPMECATASAIYQSTCSSSIMCAFSLYQEFRHHLQRKGGKKEKSTPHP